jgi:mannose-binding lectin 1
MCTHSYLRRILTSQAGVVRGFLNDGQVSYKDHHSVDSLAFGHCAYAYRNLGRPSLLSIRHDDNEFKVTVDGNTCFASPNVRIPAGYFFGISAVSAELPDSFEIFKLVVTTDTHDPLITRNDPISQGTPAEQMANAPGSNNNENVALPDDPADTSAETLVTQTQQFADLHNRLQAIFKHISTFQRDFTQYQRTSAERYTRMESNAGLPTERLNQLEERLIRIEKSIDQVKAVTGDRDYLRLHNDLLRTVKDSHSTLLENVTGVASSIPSVTIIVLLVLAFQGLLAGAYFVYKKRSMNTPKKYL